MQRSPAGLRLLRAAIVRYLPLFVLGAAGLAGCISGHDTSASSPPDAAAPDAPSCTPHVSTGMLPSNVSFRMDVVPVFSTSCALFRYCHNNDGRQGDLYLGSNPIDPDYPPTEAMLAEVRANLVDA